MITCMDLKSNAYSHSGSETSKNKMAFYVVPLVLAFKLNMFKQTSNSAVFFICFQIKQNPSDRRLFSLQYTHYNPLLTGHEELLTECVLDWNKRKVQTVATQLVQRYKRVWVYVKTFFSLLFFSNVKSFRNIWWLRETLKSVTYYE